MISRESLSGAITKNRETLRHAPPWFTIEGLYGYGVPAYIRPLLDKPLGDEPCISDLLVYLGGRLKPLRYLEIGASVGKTMYQVIHACPGEFACLDIEERHPNLKPFDITYAHGDVFDPATWQQLRGPFNLIYSDALHRPDAILQEWRMIRDQKLLDYNRFAFVWDDLGGEMTDAWDVITQEIQSLAGPCIGYTEPMYGWVGDNEKQHTVGVLLKCDI